MFCSKCGAAIPEGSHFCSQCGQAVGAPPVPNQAATQNPQFAPPAPDAPTSGKALASLITGIFGLIFFLPAIAAIILGHISRSEIRKSNGRLKGNGMATAGLVMGYGTIATLPFILILAAIAIPNLMRARIAANEASAGFAVRQINTAELSYQAAYPNVGYTCALASLGGREQPTPSAEHAQFLDDRVASGEHAGYRFALKNCINTETDHKYQVVAYPVVRHQTGVRTFCSDESGIIKVSNNNESADDCLAYGSPVQ